MISLKRLLPTTLALATLLWTTAPVRAQQPRPVLTGPIGFNPGVNYGYDNFAYSPNLPKFVDSLPGLGLAGCTLGSVGANPPYSNGTCGQNNLGQYIPIADGSKNNLYP